MKPDHLMNKYSLFSLLLLFISSSLWANEYNLLLADHTKKELSIRTKDGKIKWKHKAHALFDAWILADGSLVYSTRDTIEKMTPDIKSGFGGKFHWRYRYATGIKEKVKPKGVIYGCSPLKNGHFIITESGTHRLVEINDLGKVIHTITLPPSKGHYSNTLRLTRPTEQGTYLVPLFAKGHIVEVDEKGQNISTIDVGKHCTSQDFSAYEALPLPNQRMLISCGPADKVMIFNKTGQPEWSLEANDIASEVNLHWVTKIVPLDNGNIIICNYAKGKAKVKAFEITPKKEIVWKLTDESVKGLTSLQLLDDQLKPL
ncbi:MAG: hypothetical protein HQL32_14330 [Planctomycetes bacterium]|nr:hypothetical protein [Planctomycetota bacterium]